MTSIVSLEVKNIDFSYKDKKIYDNFSIKFNAGDRIGVLGANGCGKTTLINLMIGFLKPEKGEVLVNEKKYDFKNVEIRKKFGLVPQDFAILEELTPIENLNFFGKLNNLKGNKLTEAIQKGLELSELDDYKNKKVKTFSGGMKRRLNLALSLMCDPSIILLDEPTVGIDPHSRNFILNQLNNIDTSNKIMFYVSHYMKEIEETCNKILILNKGEIILYDTLENTFKQFYENSIIGMTNVEITDSEFEVLRIDGKYRISGFKSFEEAHKYALKHRIEVEKYEQINLEDVFIKLTGRKLRD